MLLKQMKSNKLTLGADRWRRRRICLARRDGNVSIFPVWLIGRIFLFAFLCEPIESVQFVFVGLPAAVNQATVAELWWPLSELDLGLRIGLWGDL